MWEIRPIRPEEDYPRVTALLNTVELQPLAISDLFDDLQSLGEGDTLMETAAVDAAGQVIGYCDCRVRTFFRPGRWFIYIVVDPAHRGQGAGRQLYDQALAFARSGGAREVFTQVRDDLPDSVAFAERRGYRLERHIAESVLDLAAFSFTGPVEGAGLRLTTLAEVGNTPENRRKLHALHQACARDNPSNVAVAFHSFEAYSREFFEAEWFRPEALFLAVDGDRFAAFTMLRFSPGQESAYTAFTGVDREYRGRGLALAVKLSSIRYARKHGAVQMRTSNDSENQPMLAVNQKLGYVKEPGTYRMVLTL